MLQFLLARSNAQEVRNLRSRICVGTACVADAAYFLACSQACLGALAQVILEVLRRAIDEQDPPAPRQYCERKPSRALLPLLYLWMVLLVDGSTDLPFRISQEGLAVVARMLDLVCAAIAVEMLEKSASVGQVGPTAFARMMIIAQVFAKLCAGAGSRTIGM